MLQSPNVKIHVLRGLLGFGFLAVTLQYAPVWGWWTLIPAAGALLCFGGCPMCWIVGFAGTILGGERTSLCLDGRCSDRKAAPDPPQG